MIADIDFKPKSDFATKLGQGNYSFSKAPEKVEPVNETKMSDNEAF